MPKSLAFTVIIDIFVFIYLFMDFYNVTYNLKKETETQKLDEEKIEDKKIKSQ